MRAKVWAEDLSAVGVRLSVDGRKHDSQASPIELITSNCESWAEVDVVDRTSCTDLIQLFSQSSSGQSNWVCRCEG